MYTQKIACANTNGAEQSFSNVGSTERLYKVISTKDVYIKFIPTSKVEVADNSDLLIKANVESEFFLGRGLDKIIIRNESGTTADIHVAILY
jgi:hypothetical protein